jgi:hypothetical protein
MPPFPLFQLVVARRRLLAPRTAPQTPGVPSHGNFHPLRFALPSLEPDILENESGMGLNLVQNRFNLQLNGWSPRRRFLCCSNHRLTPPTETSFSQPRSLRRSPVLVLFFSVAFLSLRVEGLVMMQGQPPRGGVRRQHGSNVRVDGQRPDIRRQYRTSEVRQIAARPSCTQTSPRCRGPWRLSAGDGAYRVTMIVASPVYFPAGG